ncbi:DUF4290 domain-containing protein [uncultured Duncaniella sp.]|uniref:DUF4290 domain-containing protein n=1 Tax=uncultured Duncaniella sp. TaxID=2768039 RepID=UPI0025B0940D|nr:DUF4290 domain-containing protein [uncultured Duncaniella sp.]
MLTYNTQLKRLVLPEYGRNIHQMVDHCLTIEDRDERTRCAHSIIASMSKLFPKIREEEDYQRKLWDHLAIMSNFKLDIDYPTEPLMAEKFTSAPSKVPYTAGHIRYRHYGKDIELMINRAVSMEEGPERDEFVMLIANHMKKLLLSVTTDGVDDSKIFKDLADYSHGILRLDPQTVRLHEFKIVAPPSNKKKKKR